MLSLRNKMIEDNKSTKKAALKTLKKGTEQM